MGGSHSFKRRRRALRLYCGFRIFVRRRTEVQYLYLTAKAIEDLGGPHFGAGLGQPAERKTPTQTPITQTNRT